MLRNFHRFDYGYEHPRSELSRYCILSITSGAGSLPSTYGYPMYKLLTNQS